MITESSIHRQLNELLIADLEGKIRRIAEFLAIKIDPKLLPSIMEHCSFDYMKAHASEVAPRGGVVWKGGASTFINKGNNGRWREVLSAAEIKAYEDRAVAKLGVQCAEWLAKGGSHYSPNDGQK